MKAANPATKRLIAELARVADGDKAALNKVYRLTSAKLYGICLHILGDRILAEDVLQEVYIEVWQGAARFDSERASPITWLCTIARNRAIDWRRASGRYEDALLSAGESWRDVGLHRDSDEGDDRTEILYRCINGLDESPRTSIRAAFLDGFTYSELAKRMEVPLGTMKSWVRRGLVQLKRCIEDG
jgi:RNA polymerase sigma factor (sigma-70 family)